MSTTTTVAFSFNLYGRTITEDNLFTGDCYRQAASIMQRETTECAERYCAAANAKRWAEATKEQAEMHRLQAVVDYLRAKAETRTMQSFPR